MKTVLIVKDGGATKVPRQVKDDDEVAALRAQGFEVEDPAEADDQADAETPAAPAPARKTAAKKKA